MRTFKAFNQLRTHSPPTDCQPKITSALFAFMPFGRKALPPLAWEFLGLPESPYGKQKIFDLFKPKKHPLFCCFYAITPCNTLPIFGFAITRKTPTGCAFLAWGSILNALLQSYHWLRRYPVKPLKHWYYAIVAWINSLVFRIYLEDHWPSI